MRALPTAATPALTWEPASRVHAAWDTPHLPDAQAGAEVEAASPRTWTVGSAVFSRVRLDDELESAHPWD
jgi:hypothetical protein